MPRTVKSTWHGDHADEWCECRDGSCLQEPEVVTGDCDSCGDEGVECYDEGDLVCFACCETAAVESYCDREVRRAESGYAE